MLTITAIAYDRHQAIIHSLQHTTHCSSTYILKGITWTWIQALTCSLPPLFGWGDIKFKQFSFICTIDWTSSITFTIFDFITCFLAPLVIIFVSYFKIIRIAWRNMHRVADLNTQNSYLKDAVSVNSRSPVEYDIVDPIHRLSLFPSAYATTTSNVSNSSLHTSLYNIQGISSVPKEGHLTPRHFESDGDTVSHASGISFGNNNKWEAHTTGRLTGLVIVFLICWLPYYVVALYEASDYYVSGYIITVVTWMTFLCSSGNPLWYAMGSRRFRRAVKDLFRKKVPRELPTRRRKHQGAAQRIGSLYRSSSDRLSKSLRSKSLKQSTASKYQTNSGSSNLPWIVGPNGEVGAEVATDSAYAVPQYKDIFLCESARKELEYYFLKSSQVVLQPHLLHPLVNQSSVELALPSSTPVSNKLHSYLKPVTNRKYSSDSDLHDMWSSPTPNADDIVCSSTSHRTSLTDTDSGIGSHLGVTKDQGAIYRKREHCF